MKWPYVIALVLTVTLAAAQWYQTTSYLCPVPISYRLGEIDQSFSLSREEARMALQQAEAVWEGQTDLELFTYDEDADFFVQLVFDERQATVDAISADEARLQAIAAENEALATQIQTLATRFDEARATFGSEQAAYEDDLEAYNERVQRINDRGGARPGEFAELEAEQQRLEQTAANLRIQAAAINQLADELNGLSQQGNHLIATYNQNVRTFNDRYSHGDEYTQGDFTPEAISIYSFANQTEMTTVLAHEFGHALGIGHVAESGSLMYYLLEESQATNPSLSQADIAELRATCQPDSLSFVFRQFIRSLIS
jgi:hypothetical protein